MGIHEKIMQEGFDIVCVWWPMELLACLLWSWFERSGERKKVRNETRRKEQEDVAGAVARVRQIEKMRAWCRDVEQRPKR